MRYTIRNKNIGGRNYDIELSEEEVRKIYDDIKRCFEKEDVACVYESCICDGVYNEDEQAYIDEHMNEICDEYHREMEDNENNHYWDIAWWAINKTAKQKFTTALLPQTHTSSRTK